VIVHSADPEGQAALVALEEGLVPAGAQALAALPVAIDGIDAAKAAAAVQELRPHAVLLATTGLATTRVLRALAQLKGSGGILQIYGLSSASTLTGLEKTGIGFSMVQVLPSPQDVRLPVSGIFRSALSQDGKHPSYVEMEGCLSVLVAAEVLHRRKSEPGRSSFLRALSEAGTVNVGGIAIDLSDPLQGARFTELVYIGPDGRLAK
jgi:ABC-type branched-subunit amino acid transport system substrate-binding protein